MAPGVIFLVEKLVGMAVSRMAALYVVEVNLLPSKVLNCKSSKFFFEHCFLNIKCYFMFGFFLCSVSVYIYIQ